MIYGQGFGNSDSVADKDREDTRRLVAMIQAQPSRMLVTEDGNYVQVLGPETRFSEKVTSFYGFGKDFRMMSYEDIRKFVDERLASIGRTFNEGTISSTVVPGEK